MRTASRDEVERNVVSANRSYGIWVVVAGPNAVTIGNVIAGNYIGTGIDGTTDLGNAQHGIVASHNSQGAIIGDASPAARNVIAGNGGNGVHIADSIDHRVLGNYIGVDRAGRTAMPNDQGGVQVYSYYYTGADGQLTSGNKIGGTEPGEGNVISGNAEYGVAILGDFATGNFVQGNLIGTDADGQVAFSNGIGVSIQRASGNIIGGTQPGAGNLISGNDLYGLRLSGSANGNAIQGNRIGTNESGLAGLGNGVGIEITSGLNNLIGGGMAGARNVIAGNRGTAISVHYASSQRNKVQGNYIGVDASGRRPLGNGYGIDNSSGASFNVYGTDGDGDLDEYEGNVIANHGYSTAGPGAAIYLGDGHHNIVAGNFLGTDATGATAMGNMFGVALNGNDNRIGTNGDGTSDEFERNVISGNDFAISIAGGSNNVVAGNYVGVDVTGNTPLANGSGIAISNAVRSARGNQCGWCQRRVRAPTWWRPTVICLMPREWESKSAAPLKPTSPATSSASARMV